jgi:hypothetical protein
MKDIESVHGEMKDIESVQRIKQLSNNYSK